MCLISELLHWDNFAFCWSVACGPSFAVLAWRQHLWTSAHARYDFLATYCCYSRSIPILIRIVGMILASVYKPSVSSELASFLASCSCMDACVIANWFQAESTEVHDEKKYPQLGLTLKGFGSNIFFSQASYLAFHLDSWVLYCTMREFSNLQRSSWWLFCSWTASIILWRIASPLWCDSKSCKMNWIHLPSPITFFQLLSPMILSSISCQ